jgi:phosphatidylserine decarboxylase
MALILVGAMLVASINTVWAGEITPPGQLKSRVWYYSNEENPIVLNKGAEMGHFKLGSTVILLFGASAVQWAADLQAGSVVRMGQLMGEVI